MLHTKHTGTNNPSTMHSFSELMQRIHKMSSCDLLWINNVELDKMLKIHIQHANFAEDYHQWEWFLKLDPENLHESDFGEFFNICDVQGI